MKTKFTGPGAAHINWSMFGARGPMREGEDDKNGGGGGGVSDEEKKFEERFNKLFHKASAEREKRLETKLSKTFEDKLGTSMTKFMDEMRTILMEEPASKGDEKPAGGEPGKQRLSPEEQAAIKKAAQEAAEAKKMAEEWKNKATQEEMRNKRNEERQQLQTLLNGKVKPSVMEMVLDQLHAKNVVRDEETGAILWKDTDGSLVPIKDGVVAWTKSDYGKEFAPPVNARGSGGRGGDGNIPVQPGSMTMEALSDIVAGSTRK